MSSSASWRVVVPLKDLRHAKSRLAVDRDLRRRLATAMAKDTLAAIARSAEVNSVVVVCQRSEDATLIEIPGVCTIVCPDLQLNAAVRVGASVSIDLVESSHVAALPADLPYLTAAELDSVLTRSREHAMSVVADHDGVGTTLLTARDVADLAPRYGVRSLRRHRRHGAVELDVPQIWGLRRDVDTLDQLDNATALGTHTRQLLIAEEGRLSTPTAGNAVLRMRTTP